MCGWQVKLCDPLVTHGSYLSALEMRSLYIKRYINSAVYLLTYKYAVVSFDLDLIRNVCLFQMAAKYKEEAEQWKQRLEDSEAHNARLREELVAVQQTVQQIYSAGAAARVLTSLSAACTHPIITANSLKASD